MAKSNPPPARRKARRGRSEVRKAPARENSGAREGILAILTSKNVRETIESIVIAFALAFLFRTFEAEAFVIPTGSMAPTLQGRHQDVDCPMCGFPYRLSASQEIEPQTEIKYADIMAGQCPNCRFWACTNRNLGQLIVDDEYAQIPFNNGALERCETSTSASGDRIIVSKFAYEFQEPKRWDIFVFRYPGKASRNYIKRLVGLPGERLMIRRGDIYLAPYEQSTGSDYEIERKPPDKVRSMAQVVYDNQYQSDILRRNRWPDRWSVWPRGIESQAGAWVASDDRREFETDGSSAEESWLRYQHVVPGAQDWEYIMAAEISGRSDLLARLEPIPQLITDAYGYNSGYLSGRLYPSSPRSDDSIDPKAMGMYWVGDLVIECEAHVKSTSGVVLLDLVEGGIHFSCEIDVATGKAQMMVDGSFVDDDRNPTAPPVGQTSVKGPGVYELVFANVDNQLVLWVDGTLVEFDAPTRYPLLDNFIPRSDEQDGGDLAPVGIGSRSAHLRVGKLRILRDVYYIAVPPPSLSPHQRQTMTEYEAGPLASDAPLAGMDDMATRIKKVMTSKHHWPDWFKNMNRRTFALIKQPVHRNKDEFLALGDNSPQSKDGRLWQDANTKYCVERELLIGKAMVIYWPLSHIQFVR